MMDMLMIVAKGLTVVNVLLILVLLYVYTKSVQKIRAPFTIGLLAFALLFLVNNIICLYFYITMQPYYAPGAEIFAVVLSATQTVAFATLAWITWK